MNTAKAFTGSATLSELVKQFLPDGGAFSLALEGEATPVAGSMAKPSVRVSAEDFFAAIAQSGAVGEAVLKRAIKAAARRAKGLPPIALPDKTAAKARAICERWSRKLPPVVRPATVRVKATARQA